MQITAAVTPATSAPFELRELELADPGPGQMVVRVTATGMCHTDLIVRDQWFPTPLPAVLGHEGVGVVERAGSAVTAVAPGDQVVLSYNSCGWCDQCAAATPNYCGQFWAHNFAGSMPDGSHTLHDGDQPVSGNFFGQSSFATHALVRERSVVRVPGDAGLPAQLLAPLGCGVQTGAGAVLNTLRPRPGSNLVVYGVGAVGLSALLAAKLAGCTRIIAVDRNEQRLKLAENLGATDALLSDSGTAKRIRTMTSGGVHYAVEATGVPAVLRMAMDSLAQGGTCVLVGAAASRATAEIDVSTLLFGRRLVGTIEGDAIPQEFIPRLIELYRAGLFRFDNFVETYPFRDINRAASDAESGRTVKPVLVW
jgi:aryl-alcohol dehydrogenase